MFANAMFDGWFRSGAEGLGLWQYELQGILAVLFVSVICGMVGTLVVGNRMAFFSDAMAHCSFAGVALGMLMALLSSRGPEWTLDARHELQDWLVPLVMVVFSTMVGIGIAYVREQTTLAADTVIGVFFAGAIGFGAVLLPILRSVGSRFDPEMFLFGNPWVASSIDVIYLVLLLGITFIFMMFRYNQLIQASFHPTLARSRGVPLRLNNYLFIILLALIVNFSLKAVGVLLINGLLIVPAATACNLAINLRQLFWLTITISVGSGLLGLWFSSLVQTMLSEAGTTVKLGPSGPILLLCVSAFVLSIVLGPWLRSILHRGVNRSPAVQRSIIGGS